ncbi:TetR family transcriptional regulator [Arthrobacter sp. ZBG10]|jgi:AcrR family transcriptional regulator|uniref:TetR/AcrR family transcriptional regulator n=1 Tax=Micrococcaceae TaxID=1268 RepID=UPI0006830750|nr:MULTISPECIES: TetR/AcrR family transcriptional regulator [Micrococcaceae]KNH15806.1 TetR family transcriptional regulator [Arthrobacter sp. ZBG10]
MGTAEQPPGRRERNKQEKLDRIKAAADQLFAEFGVDDVTTQQIAEKADIGAGTLFLYAKSKGELLLMVQNATYAEALAAGKAKASAINDPTDAVLAIVRPIVECNRKQVDNGRTYLREMAFGDPQEPRHGEALAIVGETEEAMAGLLSDRGNFNAAEAATLARVISAVMFLSMAVSLNAAADADQVFQDIKGQVEVLLTR